MVVVSQGALKGLKGTITFANETHAEVHILSRNQKTMLPRDQLENVHGDGMQIRRGDSLPMRLSFDEAAEREYVNVAEQEDNARSKDGGQTPVRTEV